MVNQNLSIPVNPDLGSQAQAICNGRGLDIITVVDYVLQQIVHNKDAASFETVQIDFAGLTPRAHPVQHVSDSNSLFDFKNIKGKSAKLGGWEGKVKITDDFNAPIDDFEGLQLVTADENIWKYDISWVW